MAARKQIITIAGRPGSGKSSTAKEVTAELGFQHFSSGDLFRALGRERGMDLLQTNLKTEENSEIDHLVDARLREIGKIEDQVVIDSRMAWHWMPQSFKVFLDLDLEIGARRILSGMDEARKISEHVPDDPAEYAHILERRLASETRRYKALYNADPYDMHNYDLVVNTATNSIAQVVELIIDHFHRWLADGPKAKT